MASRVLYSDGKPLWYSPADGGGVDGARSALERYAKAEAEAETQTALRMWAAVERFGVAELLTTTNGPLYPWVGTPLERDGCVLRDLVNSFVEEAEHRLAERRPMSLGSALDDPNFQYFVLSV